MRTIKKLDASGFKKLCFDILRRYQHKRENFRICWDFRGMLTNLKLLENPKKGYIEQMLINIEVLRDLKYFCIVSEKPLYTIPELINLLEKERKINMYIIAKNMGKISSTKCIYRLFDKYLLVKTDLHFSEIFDEDYWGFDVYTYMSFVQPSSFEFYEFYLIDKLEAILHLL